MKTPPGVIADQVQRGVNQVRYTGEILRARQLGCDKLSIFDNACLIRAIAKWLIVLMFSV
jgi:hypothetical protein